jgi:hypothetical protein
MIAPTGVVDGDLGEDKKYYVRIARESLVHQA